MDESGLRRLIFLAVSVLSLYSVQSAPTPVIKTDEPLVTAQPQRHHYHQTPNTDFFYYNTGQNGTQIVSYSQGNGPRHVNGVNGPALAESPADIPSGNNAVEPAVNSEPANSPPKLNTLGQQIIPASSSVVKGQVPTSNIVRLENVAPTAPATPSGDTSESQLEDEPDAPDAEGSAKEPDAAETPVASPPDESGSAGGETAPEKPEVDVNQAPQPTDAGEPTGEAAGGEPAGASAGGEPPAETAAGEPPNPDTTIVEPGTQTIVKPGRNRGRPGAHRHVTRTKLRQPFRRTNRRRPLSRRRPTRLRRPVRLRRNRTKFIGRPKFRVPGRVVRRNPVNRQRARVLARKRQQG